MGAPLMAIRYPLVEIRRFSDDKIQDAIDEALSHITADKPVAVIAHATLEGVKLSAAVRLGTEWSILAAAYKDWGGEGDLGAEAKVVWTP